MQIKITSEIYCVVQFRRTWIKRAGRVECWPEYGGTRIQPPWKPPGSLTKLSIDLFTYQQTQILIKKPIDFWGNYSQQLKPWNSSNVCRAAERRKSTVMLTQWDAVRRQQRGWSAAQSVSRFRCRGKGARPNQLCQQSRAGSSGRRGID